MITNKKNIRIIRKNRSPTIKGTSERPRLVFCESNRYLLVQAIDDNKANTLLFLSTKNIILNKDDYSHTNKEYASKLAGLAADHLKKLGHEKIVFDRNGKTYHGKIKIFCETMRKLGIQF